jgi:hypothetical protein
MNRREEAQQIMSSRDVIIRTISSTDWLFSMLLIGAVIGAFSGLNGMKTGWAGTAACIGGLFLKAALSSTWVYWFCGLLFAGSLLAGIASIVWKNKAVKDLILSAQYLKGHVDKDISTSIFKTSQSKDTVSLVNNIKAKMKSKGIIV